MAENTESLNILIKAKDMYSSELASMQKKFKTAGIAIAGSLTAIAAGMFAIAKQTAAAGDVFQKMAIRTGVSTQALSEFAHVAELSGTNIQEVEKSLIRMQKVAYDASNGLTSAKDTFTALGISATDVNGNLKDSGQLFEEVLDGLRGIENQAQRSAVAQEVFGKSGTKLLTIVNESADSVKRLREEARQLGITFDQKAADDAARFNDELDRFNKSIKGLSMELGKVLLPVISDLADRYVKFIKGARGLLETTEPQTKSVEDLNKEYDQQVQRIKELEERLKHKGGLDNIQIWSMQEQIKHARARIVTINEERRAINDLVIAREKEEAQRQKKTQDQETAQGPQATIEPIAGFLDQENEAREAYRAKAEEGRIAYQDRQMSLILGGIEEEIAAEQYKNEQLGMLALDRQDREERMRQDALAADQRNAQLRMGAARNIAQGLVSLLEAANTMAQGKHKDMFEFLKGARMAQAVVDTYAAANNALASVPYPYNFIAAATVIAGGLANLAIISQTQFGSSGGGGGSGAAPAAPSVVVPDLTGGETQGQAQNITVEIYNPMGNEDWDKIAEEEIIPALSRATRRNVTIG